MTRSATRTAFRPRPAAQTPRPGSRGRCPSGGWPGALRPAALGLAALLASGTLWLAPRPLLAAPAAAGPTVSPEVSRRVETLAAQAKRLHAAGRFADAATALRKAVALYDAWWLRYSLGRALEDLGDLAAARAEFLRALALDPTAEGRTRAEEHVTAVESALGYGSLVVRGGPPGARLSQDDEELGTLPLQAPLRLLSGPHALRVVAAGAVRPRTVSVDIAAGATAILDLDEAERPPAPSPTPPPAVGMTQPARGSRPLAITGWVSVGVGAALVGGGTLAWLLGDADWRKARPAEVGYGEAQALVHAGERKHSAGIALWSVGGAAAVTAVVLLVLDARATARAARAAATPLVFGAAAVADHWQLGVGGCF